MSAYLIADRNVESRAALDEYAREIPKTLERYGGRYIVRGGNLEVVEGEWKPRSLVILEFPTMEALKHWYDSEEYRPLKEMRMRAAPSDVVLVEGL